MDPIELYDLLHKRPFQPFRIHVKDGRVYDVRFPEMNMVGVSWVLIGVLAPGDTDPDPIPDHTDKVPLSWITKVEPWPPTVASAQQQAS
jgi:hypothetical protein